METTHCPLWRPRPHDRRRSRARVEQPARSRRHHHLDLPDLHPRTALADRGGPADRDGHGLRRHHPPPPRGLTQALVRISVRPPAPGLTFAPQAPLRVDVRSASSAQGRRSLRKLRSGSTFAPQAPLRVDVRSASSAQCRRSLRKLRSGPMFAPQAPLSADVRSASSAQGRCSLRKLRSGSTFAPQAPLQAASERGDRPAARRAHPGALVQRLGHRDTRLPVAAFPACRRRRRPAAPNTRTARC